MLMRLPFRSAEVKLPQIFRVSNFMQIKIAALQELANKHTLPAISMIPIPSSNMPQDLRDKQAAAPGGHNNESLYRMFAESLETRQNVRCQSSLHRMAR